MIALQNWVVVLELELVTVVYASTLVCHYWRVVSFSSENASLLFFEQLWYFYGKISLSVRAKWTLCVFTETQLFFLGATIAQWIRLCFYLPPQVWFPSTPSMLLSFIVVLVTWWKNENKQKDRVWPIKKHFLLRCTFQKPWSGKSLHKSAKFLQAAFARCRSDSGTQ